jgi:biopolymer transport protein ExbB/TolQ
MPIDLTQAIVDFALLGAEWVMWLLVVLSVISIAVMVDRHMWFRQRDTDTAAARDQIRAAFAGGDIGALAKSWKASPSIALQVAARGLEAVAGGAASAAEAMHGERVRWKNQADKNLIVLGTLGNNVPFVGLFGTVLGVIKAFEDLKQKGAAGEEAVMKGIAEALAATAIGLLVAIPAVVAFNYFGRKVKVLLGGADELAHAVLAGVHEKEKP